MDPIIKAKWLRALRSGKYKQGKQELRTKQGKYCCLGVLCQVVDPQERFGIWKHDTSMPLSGVYRAADLSAGDSYILAEANDTYGWTFEEIAAYVEVML